jgi:solute carrier family 35 protein E1
MVKIVSLLLVGSALGVSGFSLESRATNHGITGTKAAKINSINKQTLPVQHSFPTYLKSAEDTTEIVAAKDASKAKEGLWNDSTKLFAYLSVWYLGNIYYNIYNKKACIALGKNAHGGANLHWALAAVQLLVGVLFVVPQWLTGLRKAPEMTAENWKELSPVGLWASLAHAFSVLALGAGAVSFGQIVKAGEPVFAAATNALLLKDIDHPMVYAALLPIIGGVGLASLKELSFSWTALIAASAANQAAALKNVVSKGVMGKPWAKALGPQNTYAVVTILALVFTLPFVLAFDVKDAAAVYQTVLAAGTGKDVMKYSLLSGLTFYVYNEASFLALSRLSPVTHSVANTLKRVVIIVASCIVFKTPMSLLGGIGSGVAVLGTLLYSLAKKKYAKAGSSGH